MLSEKIPLDYSFVYQLHAWIKDQRVILLIFFSQHVYNICRSDFYRTIKLFFVGDGMRGKTTLLNRLRNSPVERHNERTIGIDIVKWTYPDPNRLRRNDPRLPVTFLAWDFAGQVRCILIYMWSC